MNVARTSLNRAVPTTAGRRRVAACAVLMTGALTGCAEAVSGIPVAESATSMHHVEAAPADLLPDPHEFPAAYPAVVLTPQAASAAAEDLDGVGMGATVSPVECTPPESEPGAEPPAVAVGTDEVSRASLTVELSRTTELLARVRDRLRACEQIRVSRAGAGSTVTTEVSAHVPAGADEAMTLRRSVIPDVGGAGLTQTMYTSVGRVGDIRITVTSMTFGAGEPDKAAVDELFATAVRSVRTR
ncbi:sensor domain-containing protein [Nocardia sp. NPDC050413]|uniref:sensor domain-containing protein n=1 Tax=Nocardia sp. NPDC050413 TaxID=3155784 RepID=UPI003403F2D3